MNSTKIVWIGRILSIVIMLPFLFSATSKVFYAQMYPQMPEEMAKIGLQKEILPILAALEIMCIVVYAIPQTAVLGAVLLTGYLGGAILTHLRVEQNVAMHVLFGVVIWLGVWLREPRLRAILPLRRAK